MNKPVRRKIRLTFAPRPLTELACIQMLKNHPLQEAIKVLLQEIASQSGPRLRNDSLPTYLSSNYDDSAMIKVLKTVNLPTPLKEFIKSVTQSRLPATFNYLVWLRQFADHRIDINCYIDHLKWTYDGRVDRNEVIRSMYAAQVFPENLNTFNLIAEFCIEDLIVDLWPRVEHLRYNENSNFFLAKSLTSSEGIWTSHWACYLSKCLGCSKCSSVRPITELFKISLEHGNYSACKYLWRLFNDQQKVKFVDFFLGKRLVYLSKIWDFDLHIFYLQLLDDEDIIKILKNMMRNDSFHALLLMWPWDDFLINLIQKSWDDFDFVDCEYFLNAIIDLAHDILVPDEVSLKWLNVYQQLWGQLKTDWKLTMNLHYTLRCFIYRPDLLKVIIDDPDLKLKRDELIRDVKTLITDIDYPYWILDYGRFKEDLENILHST